MKIKKRYSIIIAEESSPNTKTFTLGQKQIRIILASLATFGLLLTGFLTDYFGQTVDRWSLSQLKKENRELKQKFHSIDNQMKTLEQEVYQVKDFSKKLQLITSASPEDINNSMGFGKIRSNSALLALSSKPAAFKPANRAISSVPSPTFANPQRVNNSQELELKIKNLRGQSQLVKQDVWTLYTDLLEKQEILEHTPSIQPVRGWMSSGFGYRNETIYSDHEPHFHRGVDIASTEGSPVLASADGKVTYTGYDEHGYGNLIVLDHGYGLKTYYAHLAEIKTQVGEIIQKGEAIGSVGSTGRSTGPHLHYEVRIFGVPVNPDNYMLDKSDFLNY